jgi:ATP-binding cassette subfamily B protein
MERVERERFLAGQREGNDVVLDGLRADASNGALRSLAAALARVTAVGVGGYMVMQGDLTVGALVAFLGYLGGLFAPVQGLTTTYQTVRKGMVAIETIFGILDAEQDVPDLPGAEAAGELRGDLAFRDVSFAYRARRHSSPASTCASIRARRWPSSGRAAAASRPS